MLDMFHGVGVWTAIGLAWAVVFLLPKEQRKLAVKPWLYLVLYFLFQMLEWGHKDSELPIPFDFVGLFFLLASIGRSTLLLLSKTFLFRRLMAPMPKILFDLMQGLVYLTALIFTLNAAGVEPTSLITGSALITAGLGLALKDGLSNLFAGLALQTEKPFEIGDWIQFDQHTYHIGKVLEVNWRATKVITLDDVIVVIPNAQLALNPIRNFTQPEPWSRRSIYVVAPYDVPTQRVQNIILDAIPGAFGVLKHPAPSVVTNNFTDRGVEYWVRIFTTEFHRRDRVDGAVRDRIWYAFRRHAIPIPGTQHQVEWQELDDETLAMRRQHSLQKRQEILHSNTLFDELSSNSLSQLADATRLAHYAAGEVIIQQGDPGDCLYIIHQGEVVVSKLTEDGTEIELGRLGTDAYFGEFSLMTGEPRSATVTAHQACDLLVIDKAALAPILEASPDLAIHMSDTLAERRAHRNLKLELSQRPTPLPEQRAALLTRIKEFFSLGLG